MMYPSQISGSSNLRDAQFQILSHCEFCETGIKPQFKASGFGGSVKEMISMEISLLPLARGTTSSSVGSR